MKTVLVDTSVWIEHLRKQDSVLLELLEANRAVLHRLILGEIAVGQIKDREPFLRGLGFLDTVPELPLDSTLQYIEARRLFGKGLSFIDCALLQVAEVNGLLIYSHDRKINNYDPS